MIKTIASALYVVAAALSTWRLTELITTDKISESFRKKFPSYLFGCPRCVSVWAGAIATALYAFFPLANVALALSWLYMAHIDSRTAKHLTNVGRQLIISIKPEGMVIDKQEFFPHEIEHLKNNLQIVPSPAQPQQS